MAELYAVAFAGVGETSKANVAALLADFLSEDNDYNPPIFPEEIAPDAKGLTHAYDWVAKEFGTDNIERHHDIIGELVRQRDEEKAKPFLVYVPSDGAVPFYAAAAAEAGVPVLDLTQGLDDFAFPSQPEPEPELVDSGETGPNGEAIPEPRQARRRGVPRADAPAPLDEPVTIPATDAAPGEIEASMQREDPPWDEGDDDEPRDTPKLDALMAPVPSVQVTLSQATVDLLLATFSSLAQDVASALVPKPKADMVAVYVSEDGSHRKVEGRGRPRKGETRTEITVEQAEEKGL